MSNYIKYKRIHERILLNDIEKLFDKLITEGWEIISYDEIKHTSTIEVTMIVGKKQITTHI